MLKSIVVAMAALFASHCFAAGEGEALSRCLSDNSTGKDRKMLTRWMFVSMASHPEMRDLARVDAAELDRVSKDMGAMFNRLVLGACRTEFRAAAHAADARAVMQSAFSAFGQVASRELMLDPDVRAALGGFEPYLNKDELRALSQ